MKKHVLLTTMLFLLTTTIALSVPVALAGDMNQNASNGTQGTEIVNGMDGCRPDVQAGSVFIQIFPGPAGLWEGGPCCADRADGPVGSTSGGDPIYESNQCCNPPDDVALQPGNHCECFHLRGYPPV